MASALSLFVFEYPFLLDLIADKEEQRINNCLQQSVEPGSMGGEEFAEEPHQNSGNAQLHHTKYVVSSYCLAVAAARAKNHLLIHVEVKETGNNSCNSGTDTDCNLSERCAEQHMYEPKRKQVNDCGSAAAQQILKKTAEFPRYVLNNQFVDAGRVAHGTEMRAGVVILIYGLNLHFGESYTLTVKFKEHVCFILIAVTADFKKRGEKVGRSRAQTGLGIAERNAAACAENEGSDLVALLALGRYEGEIKIAATHNECVFIAEQCLTAIINILRKMLTVTVSCDSADEIAAVIFQICNGCLKCSTLAAVNFVHKQRDLLQGGNLLKRSLVCVIAAVVDNNYVGKTNRNKAINNIAQLLCWVQ